METLRIEWHRTFDNNSEGFMELNCDKFFPCIQKKAQKVFPLVRRWCSDEVIAELEQYLIDKEAETLQLAKEYYLKYGNAHQKVHDLQEMISSGKHPNGVRLNVVEYAQAKSDLKNYKKIEAACLKTTKSLVADNGRYKKKYSIFTERK